MPPAQSVHSARQDDHAVPDERPSVSMSAESGKSRPPRASPTALSHRADGSPRIDPGNRRYIGRPGGLKRPGRCRVRSQRPRDSLLNDGFVEVDLGAPRARNELFHKWCSCYGGSAAQSLEASEDVAGYGHVCTFPSASEVETQARSTCVPKRTERKYGLERRKGRTNSHLQRSYFYDTRRLNRGGRISASNGRG